ncbi:M48 family metalloprotease [Rubrimonas cliftonensis]|uniref:Putative Zn-dependent protease, contains TPR repeats n=1 Tax=Rubrimonas cliftonensis TaxID=89524 RepID=A0A1H4BD27_9RHOB|nr:M48 family metalloprotease [Rubrimonas cliftonensis]SEA46073.1 Putative Zn-dependent protease, contains TPR repeats [Rubrimonas cliftonensis]
MSATVRKLSAMLRLVAALLCAFPASAGGFVRDAEIERTLSMMTRPIFEAAGVAPESVRVLLLDDPALNAFVANGRTMVLNTGLLRRMPEADTIIGVIAHETGHITGGHLARRAIAARQVAGPALLATILAAAGAAAAGSADLGAAAVLGGQEAIRRSLLAYSRAEEASADQAAVSYMNRAGVDPSGMLEILRLFKGQEVFSTQRLDPYALSHPLSSERISLLESRIAQSPMKGAPLDPQIDYWHERMRAKLDGFLERPERVLSRLELADEPDSEMNLYRRAIALHRMADVDAALATLGRLLDRRPDDPFYWELRGQVLLESGRAPEAVTAYRRAVALAPAEPLIAGALGRSLLATGAEDEALVLLKRAVRDDPGEPGLLRDLARAYAHAGDDGMAALTTAERVALGGDLDSAARLARRAMGLLPTGSPGWLRADDIAALAPDND